MICQKSGEDLPEKDIHESHDVPCYLFLGNRKGQKNQADKWGRHWLCKKCHDEYEELLRDYLKETAKVFSLSYFKKDGEEDDTKTTT